MRTFTACVVFSGLLASGLAADNWPQWRGPHGTGVSSEKGLPTQWSDTENVAWRARLAGEGVSSPIVWGDDVFVTSQRGDGALRRGNHPTLVQGQDPRAAGERPLGGRGSAERGGTAGGVSFIVEAFDRRDGRRLWAHTTAADGRLPEVHEKHNLATASAATDGERIYAWFGTGQLVALDFKGNPVWTRHLGAEYSPFLINWGHGSSPIVYNDSLILVCFHEPAAYLLAVDKRSGKTRWKADRGRDVLSYSTPLVVAGPSGPESDELIINTSEALEAYSPATGELLWRADEASRFPIPSPVHQGGTLYATRGYRSGPYAAIRLGGRGEISKTHVEWKVPTGAPYISSFVYSDGLLYMAGDLGVVTCIEAKTGERVWQERIGGVFTASPVAADGKIYLLSESGETVVLRAGRTPQVLARNKLDGHAMASPAVAGGRLFIRTDEELIAVGK